MNKQLARQVFAHVLTEDNWRQSSWAAVTHDEPLPQSAFQEFLVPERSWDDESVEVTEVDAIPVDACQTAKCFAGWAVSLAHPRTKMLIDGSGSAEYALLADNSIVEIRAQAKEDLGLSDRDADALFNGGNGVEELTDHLVRLGAFRDWDDYEDEDV